MIKATKRKIKDAAKLAMASPLVKKLLFGGIAALAGAVGITVAPETLEGLANLALAIGSIF